MTSNYEKYKETNKKAVKNWAKKNPEKVKEYYNKYRHTEKGRIAAMEAQRRYRAKKKAMLMEETIENVEDDENPYEYDNYRDHLLEQGLL